MKAVVVASTPEELQSNVAIASAVVRDAIASDEPRGSMGPMLNEERLQMTDVVNATFMTGVDPELLDPVPRLACGKITHHEGAVGSSGPDGVEPQGRPLRSMDELAALVEALGRRVDGLQALLEREARPAPFTDAILRGLPNGSERACDLPWARTRPAHRKRVGKALVIAGLVVGGACGLMFGIPGVTKPLVSLIAPSDRGLITYRVMPGKFSATVRERGVLESSQHVEVLCGVEGKTTILSILPEGTRVTKGQLVCELDSSALKNALTNQVIVTREAQALYDNAETTYHVAVTAANEYVNGIYPQELQAIDGEIALAEANLTRASDRLDWSNKVIKMQYISISQNLADRSALATAEIILATARKKKEVLERYSKERKQSELKAAVEKALSDKLAKHSALILERQKEDKLRDQIEKCKLYAPAEGMVVHVNDDSGYSTSGYLWVEEGATVRERQKIFRLPDAHHFRVNAKIHESKIDRIRLGLPARIRVDAFPNKPLTGTVEKIALFSDPNVAQGTNVKAYTTLVPIEHAFPGLRLGMSAQVEIEFAERENVLSVPVQAVFRDKGKYHVFVMTLAGARPREVRLGISDDKRIEVEHGLEAGDNVVLNPATLLARGFAYPGR